MRTFTQQRQSQVGDYSLVTRQPTMPQCRLHRQLQPPQTKRTWAETRGLEARVTPPWLHLSHLRCLQTQVELERGRDLTEGILCPQQIISGVGQESHKGMIQTTQRVPMTQTSPLKSDE